MLKHLAGVSRVEPLHTDANRYCFALSGDKPAEQLAPTVATAITQKGWPLYGLSPETRSLERVFSEINMAAGREQ